MEGKELVIQNLKVTGQSVASRPVSFLSEPEIYSLAGAAKSFHGGERNELLVLTMFQLALRVSEAINMLLKDKFIIDGKHAVGIMGKGRKPRLVACPDKLFYRLGNYASEHGLGPEDRFFPITRVRAWQIVKAAAKKAGIDDRRVYNCCGIPVRSPGLSVPAIQRAYKCSWDTLT